MLVKAKLEHYFEATFIHTPWIDCPPLFCVLIPILWLCDCSLFCKDAIKVIREEKNKEVQPVSGFYVSFIRQTLLGLAWLVIGADNISSGARRVDSAVDSMFCHLAKVCCLVMCEWSGACVHAAPFW